MTIADLQEHIRRVVLYNWSDEERDYEACEVENENSREGHIFHDLKALAEFIELGV